MVDKLNNGKIFDKKAQPSLLDIISEWLQKIEKTKKREKPSKNQNDISRREFLKRFVGGVALGAMPVPPNFFDRDSSSPPKDLTSIENDLINQEKLSQLDPDIPATSKDFVANKSDFVEICRTYYSNQLKQKKFTLTRSLLLEVLQTNKGINKLYDLLTGTARNNLATESKKSEIIQVLSTTLKDEDLPESSLLREIFDTFYTNPISFAQLMYAYTNLDSIYNKLPNIDLQISFNVSDQKNTVEPKGYYQEKFDYIPQRPLERYEPDDFVENHPILPELQQTLLEAQEKFGVPASIIEAIFLIEGGGSSEYPGATLSTRVQEYAISHNFNFPENEHLIGEPEALGPGQATPQTLEKFAFAVKILWPEIDAQNVHNIKHAIALSTAKLYVDTLALKDAEPYRYTSLYQEKRAEAIKDLYLNISRGNIVANDEKGLQSILEEYGPLKKEDLPLTVLATIDYHGTDKKYQRLGNRSYDEFCSAYVHGYEKRNKPIPYQFSPDSVSS